MSGYIEWLEGLNNNDTRVRAVLRRGLSFEPGRYIPAFPYVEPFVKGDESAWHRRMHALVAGLWAFHWREGRAGTPMPLGKAAAMHQISTGSTSTERRFIALLDADEDQLPHRLRQMIALLKEHAIDFDSLLKGLLHWNDEQKRTQNAWARDFYRNIDSKVDSETKSSEEKTE